MSSIISTYSPEGQEYSALVSMVIHTQAAPGLQYMYSVVCTGCTWSTIQCSVYRLHLVYNTV